MTDRRLRLLWVSPWSAPSLVGGGEQLRQASLLLRLGERHDVHIVAPHEPEDRAVRAAVGQVTIVDCPHGSTRWTRSRPGLLAHALFGRDPLVAAAERRRRRAFRAAVEPLAAEVDAVLVEHVEFARIAGGRHADPAWILTAHYLPSRQAEHLAALGSPRWRWLWATDVRRAGRLERWAARRYDAIVAVSPDDASALEGMVSVVPNGVSLDRPVSPLPAEPTVLFLGSLDTRANVDGISWFVGEAWPEIRQELPAARLVVAGRSPTAEVVSLVADAQGVELLPDVADVTLVLEMSRIVVVPLRVGSGTRIKALQGLAHARVVVGTSIGLEGLGLTDRRDALVADDPRTLAASVVAACLDGALASRVAAAGRTHAQEHFSWTASADALDRLLQKVVPRSRSG